MTVTVDNLSASRGGLRTFEGVSFTLGAGQALRLVGPNGSGKTTLLRTLAGLQPADAGTIDADPDALLYAGHLDGVKSTLTVAENLAFWARLYGTGAIDEALRTFKLDSFAARPARNLSAGQKRRLGLARLLVANRPVWLLDEPTVSLDTATVALFGEVVRAHLAGGGSALIATHIDLGLEADALDMTAFAPTSQDSTAFDEAFL